jgi:porin
LELKAGIWDGAPDGGNWGFSGTGEIFAIGQLTANYTLGCNDLPGDTHIGAWNHNGTFADQGGGADHGANYGVYWGMSQLLKRECPCDDEQGLGAFGQWGWAPEDRNEAEQYWGAGLVYTGLLRGRDADTIGIGVGNMSFGDRIPGTQDETMIELFYKARLGPHVVLQPDFQYFSNPRSGGTTNADSFVVGLRFQIVL